MSKNLSRTSSPILFVGLVTLVTLVTLVSLLAMGCEPTESTTDKTHSNVPTQYQTPMITTLDELKQHRPGIHQQLIKRDDDTQSSFTILVPENYDGNTPAPLVVALHFGGGGVFYGRGILSGLVAPALHELDPIIVAPDVIGRNWADPENEKFIFKLMEALEREYKIDPNKILLTGFSMGGHGTFYIGSRNQDRFTAAIPIAGFPRGVDASEWTLPFYVIHSNGDKRVPMKPAKDLVEKIKQAGGDATFSEVDGLAHGNTGNYVPALNAAIPWLKDKWGSANDD